MTRSALEEAYTDLLNARMQADDARRHTAYEALQCVEAPRQKQKFVHVDGKQVSQAVAPSRIHRRAHMCSLPCSNGGHSGTQVKTRWNSSSVSQG